MVFFPPEHDDNLAYSFQQYSIVGEYIQYNSLEQGFIQAEIIKEKIKTD